MTSRTHQIYNIIFEHGFDPTPVWTMLKKTALFLKDGFPKRHTTNKLWWTGNTLTSKLKNTGPLVIDFVLVKAFKTRKYIENSRMTKQYERQWRAPVKPGESKRYSTHQNIHEENKKKYSYFPLHQLSHNVSKSTLPLHWVHPKYKHKMTFFWPHKAVWW